MINILIVKGGKYTNRHQEKSQVKMEIEIEGIYSQTRNDRSEAEGCEKQFIPKDFGENMAVSTP